ncbi:FG-GAP-like repeat-containing protein [Streptomyces xanthophaeus]
MAYWTAERMAQATPLDAERGAMADVGSAAPGARDTAGTPKGVYFDGLPMVGTFFHDGTPLGGNTYCTGSVVRSKGKALVLTAGHCANGLASAAHRIFVPQYRHGKSAAAQPADGGVSGSPWIKGYNAAARTGQVVGNTGGYNGGGNDSDDHWISYSPLFGKDAQDLYNDADNGIGPGNVHRPPYQPPTDGPVLPGSGATWKHAKQIASGDFSGTGHSDLLVIWTDGEATLYPGDGNGGFRRERQLLAPNAGWKPVATITAGDFTGTGEFDLMVRWDDGRMTLHGDVGSNGLGAGTEMAPSGSIWSHATQIAAGRFNATTYVTDLMVRWSDGELSFYTNMGAGTLGQEYKLKDPNSTWKDATLLTAGQFSGNQKWDLMVRWSTGALNNYVGTTTGGLGAERPIHAPTRRGPTASSWPLASTPETASPMI